jgi:MFS family permease
MATGAFTFAFWGIAFALVPPPSLPIMFVTWMLFGLAESLVMTPGALVITKSVALSGRTSVFAAQFSLSHAGWLVAYPLAGWLGAHLALETALLILSFACIAFASVALRIWPTIDPLEREHTHPELPVGHPHLRGDAHVGSQHRHIHAFYIDELHPTWNQGAI